MPTSSLLGLLASLKSGSLSLGVSDLELAQIAGPLSSKVAVYFQGLCQSGISSAAIGHIVEAIIDERRQAVEPGQILELILSGPDIPAVPAGDTAAAMRTLVEEAEKELLIIGYIFHHASDLLKRICERMRENSLSRVIVCLDIQRPYGDTSPEAEIISGFSAEFKQKHWPWQPIPDVYFDPRSLSVNTQKRSSLHAKCLVADSRSALITSANFTDAAQFRNIEVGALIRHSQFVERISDYFRQLIDKKLLSPLML